jgi:hypothetical protein
MDNVGNGFLDIGAWYQLRTACPDAEIISISNTLATQRYFFANPTGLMIPRLQKRNMFDLRMVFDADYIVFTAACLADYWFKHNADLIDWLIKTQIKIVILGASGNSGALEYDPEELKKVRSVVEKMNLFMLISRDHATFEQYGDLATHSFNGVDCALFMNDAFRPAKMKIEEFDVFAFDGIKEPKIATDKKVLRLCHKVSWVDSFCQMIRSPKKVLQLSSKTDWMSDFPEDYLHIYANCNTVYTDRVHACVASLIFGNKAMYMSDSPRYGLLPRILQGADILKEPVMLDLNYIAGEKKRQLEFIAGVFSS